MSTHFLRTLVGILAPVFFFFLGGWGRGGRWEGVAFILFTYYTVPSWKWFVSAQSGKLMLKWYVEFSVS